MGTWDDPESKVTVNGIPLNIHIEKTEIEEKLAADIAKSSEIYKDNSLVYFLH